MVSDSRSGQKGEEIKKQTGSQHKDVQQAQTAWGQL